MTEFYPGSKMVRKNYDESAPEKPSLEPDLDGRDFKGTDLYTVGVLADVLNRKPVTMRKWESEGVIPKPTYIRSSTDARGRRRLYTKPQILGLRKIANEEGILEPSANGKWKPIELTEFREKALQLFRNMES